jgi:hypothetical protein
MELINHSPSVYILTSSVVINAKNIAFGTAGVETCFFLIIGS